MGRARGVTTARRNRSRNCGAGLGPAHCFFRPQGAEQACAAGTLARKRMRHRVRAAGGRARGAPLVRPLWRWVLTLVTQAGWRDPLAPTPSWHSTPSAPLGPPEKGLRDTQPRVVAEA